MFAAARWPSGDLWAYIYQIVPPLANHRLDELKRILERERGLGGGGGRRWVAKLVLERRTTYILIVSNSSMANHRAHWAIEQELSLLSASYHRSDPVLIALADAIPDSST